MEKRSSTKSVIILLVNTVPIEFIEWLRGEMKSKNWGMRETARQCNVSHPTIVAIFNGERPSFETVMALHKTFNKEPVGLLRLAGLLPPEKDENQKMLEARYLLSLLPLDQQEIALGIIQHLVEENHKKST
jgi:transcriptional regulator with XRE-family HTH domain